MVARALFLPVPGRVLLHDAGRTRRVGDHVSKDEVLDFVFEHLRMTKVNAAIVTQFHASSPDELLGRTPAQFFAAAGNLWVANTWSNSLAAFSPAQLAGIGSPAPHIVITSRGGR